MQYKVEFLDDQTFEALPYRDMHEKVGVADPKTMRAFVRKSGMPVMDVFNAAHELEHLKDGHEGVHADHYDPDHGVYYKNFGNVLSAVAPLALAFIPGVGPLLSGALGGFGSALSGFGSSVAGALGSIPGIGGALGGAAQSIGGALGSVGGAAGKFLGVGGGAGSGSSAAGGGYAANAGRIGSEMGGYGIGSGTAAGSAAASGAGGMSRLLGNTAKSLGQNIGQNGLMSMFGEQQQLPNQMSQMGSSSPNVSGSSSPNMIAGASGSGSGGGPGGSPGSVGGGQVSKIKQQYEQQNSPFSMFNENGVGTPIGGAA